MIGLKTNLQEIIKNENTPFCSDELGLLIDLYSDDRYYLPETKSKITTVDVSKIIGHAQGYNAMTWNHMLFGLKRINRRCNELIDNPDYYFQDAQKIDWSFIEIEGNYFISSGKHRTTVFKYFSYLNPNYFKDGPIIRGVDVIHRKIDYKLEKKINEIEQLLLNERFKHIKFGCRRSYTDSLSKFYLANSQRNIGYHFFKENDLLDILNDLQIDNRFTRFTGKGLGSFLRKTNFFPW